MLNLDIRMNTLKITILVPVNLIGISTIPLSFPAILSVSLSIVVLI